MITWIKIAVRNLFRNKRRSLFTTLAIGLGFFATNVFGGFTEYIFESMKEAYIYTQANGHLTIFKEGFLAKAALDPVGYLLNEGEVANAREVLEKFEEVAVVTPQLFISGLLSNGQVSTIFIAAGRVPSHSRLISSYGKGLIAKIKIFEGKDMQDDVAFGIAVTRGLAKHLGLGLESNAIAMATTVSGQINALDAQIFELFESPVEALDSQLALVPLEFAQSLYDTTSVDRLTVLLHHTEQTETIRDELVRKFVEAGLKVEIKTWEELSTFYTKVRDMFNVIFLFIFVVVFVIAVMSVINTIGMTVLERTREIGTLRALGVKRRGVVALIAIESTLLGLSGTILGVILTLLSWVGVKALKPTWSPPQITQEVPLEVYLVPKYMMISFGFLVLLSLVAAIAPARKAARMGIVDALGHV